MVRTHAVLLFSLITLLSGVVAIVVASLSASRFDDRDRKTYLAFLVTFTVSVFLFLVDQYAYATGETPSRAFLIVWGVVDGLTDLSVVVAGVLFYHSLYEMPRFRVVQLAVFSTSILVSVPFAIDGARAIGSTSPGLPLGVVIGLIYYYALFAYLIGLNLFRVWSLRGTPKRVLGIGVLVIALVGAVESVLTGVPAPDGSIADRIASGSLYVSTIPYLAWTAVSTIILLQADRMPAVPAGLEAFCLEHGITDREREVLEAIARGWSNQEIAGRLFISLQTVKTHAHHLYEKTGTRGRTALVAAISLL